MWNARPKGHVWTPCVIMGYPCLHDASQVVLGQRDDKIQAFSPQRPEQSFAEGIRLGALRRSFQDPEPQVLYTLIEFS